MRLVRTLALFFTLLPSAASGTTWRVDFTAEVTELFDATGTGFITLPADGIIRGAYFYDDTPFNPSMYPGHWEISWMDGQTGSIVRIGPDVFTCITSEDPSTSYPEFLAIHWTDNGYLYDEEEPENSYYYDSYAAATRDNDPGGYTSLDLQWNQTVLESDANSGAPMPNLLSDVSFTEIPDLSVPSETFWNLKFEVAHGGRVATLFADVTDLSIHVSPVPEPEQSTAVGAGVAGLAVLARRCRGGTRGSRP
ncbi:MAG TPA: hypothetical protein VMW19_00855 [Myxococcota bacterium]|nr:hypothetical protein [Myxococcota bacterium]